MKKLFGYIIQGFLLGVGLLCVFSALQKASLGVNIYLWYGYLVPFFFGGTTGSIVGFLYHKQRKAYLKNLRIEREGQQELNKLVEEKTKDLKTLNELLLVINFIITHDLSNALNIIKGNLELYKETQNEKFLDEISKSSNKSISLLEKIRKIQYSSLKNDLQRINTREVILEVISNYDFNFTIKGEGDILADEAIISVFDNIFSNIKNHANTNRVEIVITNQNGYCEITIKDYGRGIEEKIKNLFHKEDQNFRDFKKVGLGLLIIKKTVERYGGTAKVRDNNPSGTIFIIRLKSPNPQIKEKQVVFQNLND